MYIAIRNVGPTIEFPPPPLPNFMSMCVPGSSHLVIQLFQLRLFPSKAEKSNTSAKSLLGMTIKNTQTEQNLISRDTYSRDFYS